MIPRLTPPPAAELDAIHAASLHVLEHVGVVFPELLGVAVSQAAGEHEGNLGGLDRVLVHVQAEAVFERDAGGEADFGELAKMPSIFGSTDGG